MKLKELLLTMKGYELLSLYDSDDGIINTEASNEDILENQDKEVRHIDVWIYDDAVNDVEGKKVPVKRIRACVYLLA